MIGTSASAGCSPLQKNANHETHAGGQQIWPEAADAPPPQSGGDADGPRQDQRHAGHEVDVSASG